MSSKQHQLVNSSSSLQGLTIPSPQSEKSLLAPDIVSKKNFSVGNLIPRELAQVLVGSAHILSGSTAARDFFPEVESSAPVIRSQGAPIGDKAVVYQLWSPEAWAALERALGGSCQYASLVALPEFSDGLYVINILVHPEQSEEETLSALFEEQYHVERGCSLGVKFEFIAKLYAQGKMQSLGYTSVSVETILSELINAYQDNPAEIQEAVSTAIALVSDLDIEQVLSSVFFGSNCESEALKSSLASGIDIGNKRRKAQGWGVLKNNFESISFAHIAEPKEPPVLNIKYTGYSLAAAKKVSRGKTRESSKGPEEDELVIVSVHGLHGIFDNSQKVARKINHILGDPRESESEEVVYRSGNNAVTFSKVMSGSKLVWSFKKKDRDKIANIFGALRLEDLKAEERGVSQQGLKGVFANASVVASTINSELGLPGQSKQIKLVYEKGDISCTFTIRRVAFKPVWSFKQGDKGKVAKLFGITDLEPLEDGEVAVSGAGLKGSFTNPELVARALNTTLGDPENANRDTLVRDCGDGAVCFTRRKVGPKTVWSFQRKDTVLVRGLIGALDSPKDLEIRVSGPGLQGVFLGYDSAAVAINKVLGDPKATEAIKKVCKKVGTSVTFIRREFGTQILWAFPQQDVSKVATLFNLNLSEDQQEALLDRVGISEAVALLGHDPFRLLQWLKIYHSDLAPDQINNIASAAIAGISSSLRDTDAYYKNYSETLPIPSFNPSFKRSGDRYGLTVTGSASQNAQFPEFRDFSITSFCARLTC